MGIQSELNKWYYEDCLAQLRKEHKEEINSHKALIEKLQKRLEISEKKWDNYKSKIKTLLEEG